MSYLDDVKQAEFEFKRMFRVNIQLKDLPQEEQKIYTDQEAILKDKDVAAYRSELENEIKANEQNQRMPAEYFLRLLESKDPEALKIQEKKEEYQQEYEARAKDRESLPGLIVEKNSELAAAGEEYQKLNKAYQDSLNAEIKKRALKNLLEVKKLTDQLGAYDAEVLKQKETAEKYKKEYETNANLAKKYKDALDVLDPGQQEIYKGLLAAAEKNRILWSDAKSFVENAPKERDKIEQQIKTLQDANSMIPEQVKNEKKFQDMEERVNQAYQTQNQLKKESDLLTERYNAYDSKVEEMKNLVNAEKEHMASYAAARLKDDHARLTEKLDNVSKYQAIDAALKNTAPVRNATVISKGMAELTNVYRTYYKNHNWFSRTFRFFGTPAATDYKKFDSLRTTYIKASGIPEAEVDKYLDDKVLTGSLKTNVETSKIDLEYKANCAVNRDYSKRDGASDGAYVKEMKFLYSRVMLVQGVDGLEMMAQMNVCVDKGLKMLSAVYKENQKSPSPVLKDFVGYLSKGVLAYDLHIGRPVQAEIDNVTGKPKEIHYEFKNKDLTPVYEAAKAKAMAEDAREGSLSVLSQAEAGRKPVRIPEDEAQGGKPDNDFKEKNLAPEKEIVVE